MREVLKLVDELNGTITSSDASRKLNVNQKEVDKVFLWLIDNDNVIDYSNKRGITIARKRGIDYLSLSKSLNTQNSHKTTHIDAPKNRLASIWYSTKKSIIVVIITIVSGFLLYLLVQWYESCFVVV
jgi:hypothetical protein